MHEQQGGRRRGESGTSDDRGGGAPNGVRSLVARRYGGAAAGPAPTIHDVATVAVEHKAAGRAVDGSVATAVGAHLGTDFSGVRVHDDPLAQEATQAMGARAFAYGADVFLGPGESGGDLGLMAHELTHVAQQGAAGQRAPQRQVQVGDANSPAEHQADQVAAAVTGGQAATHLLVDAGPVGPGQMLKSQFVDQLRAEVTAAANEELGPAYSAVGCPLLDQYFGRYHGQPAATGEALLRRFAPATRSVRTAADMIPAVVTRVREGVRAWRDSGQPPAEFTAAEPAAVAAATAAVTGTAQALRAPDGQDTLASLEAELGPGASLDSGTARRMGGALGVDVAGARIHTGPAAARKAAEVDAMAFTVGANVVMGARAPAVGTHDGDAVLLHELAHTAQQREAAQDPQARRAPIGGEAAAAEDHAEAAAGGAMARLHSGDVGLSPLGALLGVDFQTGLQIQRCGHRGPTPLGTAATATNNITDGPYGWQSKFEVTLTAGMCRVVMKPRLIPDSDVPATDVAAVKTRAAAAFTRIFDNKFILTDTADSQQYTLRTEVQFVDRGEHATINLHSGNNRSDSGNWSVGRPDETFAHELGHLLGLKDEYPDAASPTRATFTDHSIMGNYHSEGPAAAQMQLRHGQTVASEIGGATGRSFTVTQRP